MWYTSHMRYPPRRHIAVHDAAGVRHQHALHAGHGPPRDPVCHESVKCEATQLECWALGVRRRGPCCD
jgi:hypothetical protein